MGKLHRSLDESDAFADVGPGRKAYLDADVVCRVLDKRTSDKAVLVRRPDDQTIWVPAERVSHTRVIDGGVIEMFP